VTKNIIEEFKIQRECSRAPRDGDAYLYYNWRSDYVSRSEDLFVSPLAFFILENPIKNQSWVIIVSPKFDCDLEQFKTMGLDNDTVYTILGKLEKVVEYMWSVRNVSHRDLKPRNILINFETENGKIKMKEMKITDFGLSQDTTRITKLGGTPIFSSPWAFVKDGAVYSVDWYSLFRITEWICLETSDWIQLAHFPIIDDESDSTDPGRKRRIIKEALDTFPILKWTKEGIRKFSKSNLSYTPPSLNPWNPWNYKISRADLIGAGIDSNWFIDQNSEPTGELKRENFNLQNLK